MLPIKHPSKKQPTASQEVYNRLSNWPEPKLRIVESCPDFSIFNSIGFMAQQNKKNQKNFLEEPSPHSVTNHSVLDKALDKCSISLTT